MNWQRYLAGGALIAFFATTLVLAQQMGPARSPGDVGGAFLPSIAAIVGVVLSLAYLAGIWAGRANINGKVHWRGLVYLGLVALMAAAVTWLPLALGLAVVTGLGVIMMDGPKHILRAAGVAVAVFVTAWFGFGALLGLPLP